MTRDACVSSVNPHEALVRALIRKSHAHRMANKDKFLEMYDLVSRQLFTICPDCHIYVSWTSWISHAHVLLLLPRA